MMVLTLEAKAGNIKSNKGPSIGPDLLNVAGKSLPGAPAIFYLKFHE